MKLALVNLTRQEREPPLGLAYIAAYLREHAPFVDTIIIDQEDPVSRINREKPDLVGVSALSFFFRRANEIAGIVRRTHQVPLIVGGYHISALPHHLQPSHFDIGVLGEGEQTMLELVRLCRECGGIQPGRLRSIPGLVFRNEEGAIEQTLPRALIEPLDRLPLPARDLLRMRDLYLTPRHAIFPALGVYAGMLTSRGCPYRCAFCSPSQFWGRFRVASPLRVVEEIEHLMHTYPVDGIMVWDDLFVVNRSRLESVVELIEAKGINRRIQFAVFARANLINAETVRLMQRMNVTAVSFGLESGADPVLHYLKGGSVTVEDNYRALRLCRAAGMRTTGTVIVGSPGETEADLQQTLDLIRSPDLDHAVVCHLTPLPGTEVWTYARELGVVSEDPCWNYGHLPGLGFRRDLILSRHLSPDELEAWYDRMEADAARHTRPLWLSSVRFRYWHDRRVLRRIGLRVFGMVRRLVRRRR